MRLLILGASGFLGGHVWRQAAAAGAEVVTAGRAGLPCSAAHQRLDLAADDPAAIAEIIASVAPDAIANCAGLTVGGPDVLAAANITGAYTLVRAMLLAETPARLGAPRLGGRVRRRRARRARSASRRRRGLARRTGRPSWPAPGWSSWAGRPGSTPWCCGCSTRSAPGRRRAACPGRVAAQLRRALAGDAERAARPAGRGP